MQINLLSIFKYENSFEKSVGYVFVQMLDIKWIILVTMMCQWILLEHFFSYTTHANDFYLVYIFPKCINKMYIVVLSISM